MNLQFKETDLNLYKDLSEEFKQDHLIIDPNTYLWLAGAEHRYFAAYRDGDLVGLSAMVKYLSKRDNEIKIYHRASWTRTDQRRQGIWTSLKKHKFQYCKEFKWCKDNTTHLTSCSTPLSYRYKNLGWKHWKTGRQIIEDGSVILRDWWYTDWQQIKTGFNIEE